MVVELKELQQNYFKLVIIEKIHFQTHDLSFFLIYLFFTYHTIYLLYLPGGCFNFMCSLSISSDKKEEEQILHR